jgi:CubicO group peptidase (beta-lactamase class C family)
LHHQSGIPDYTELLEEDYDERTTVDDALDVLRDVDELDFVPGSAFEYSNSGYFLLSLVVDSVTGTTLAAYLDDEVFGPLGLDAVMDPVPDLPARALSYERDGSEYVVADSKWEQTGDGGVQTTPGELVRWASQYWDPTLGGHDLLVARTAGAVDDGEGTRYGAGIVISEDADGRTRLSHAGAWAGFVSDLVIVPADRVAVAVACNTSDHDPTALAEELVEAWLAP